MDSDDECVDVGHAFLDLQELLLTGNDVTEQQIDSRCCTCMMGCFFGGGVAKEKMKTVLAVIIISTSILTKIQRLLKLI